MRDAWRDLLRPKLQVAKNALFEEQQKLTENMGKKARLDAQVATLKKILNTSSCPTCGLPTDEKKRIQAGTELAQIEDDLKMLNVDSNTLSDLTIRIREIDRLGRSGSADKIQVVDDEYLRSSVELTKSKTQLKRLTKKSRAMTQRISPTSEL